MTPPAIEDHLFETLNTADILKIEKNFAPLVINDLLPYLNNETCLSDLPELRKQWVQMAKGSKAFDRAPKMGPYNWYIFHYAREQRRKRRQALRAKNPRQEGAEYDIVTPPGETETGSAGKQPVTG
jgi:hypothetical protein